MSFAGTLLRTLQFTPNYYWHWQILDLTLFLAIGNIFKDMIKSDKNGSISAIVYAVLAAIGIIAYGARKMPYVTAGFGTSVAGWPLHVALALTGSVAVLWLARKLTPSIWLEYLGRNSLVVYMTQWTTLHYLLGIFSNHLNSVGKLSSAIAVFVIAMTTCGIAAVIAHVVNTTPLRIVMGKYGGR